VFGPDILQEAEKQVRMVRENLRVAQSRQKSYADHRRREFIFELGYFVYLKVSPMKGLHHFEVRGKLAPRFIRPFKILETLERVTQNMRIKMCKVQWSHHTEEEATWEREEELKAEFPSFFSDPSKSRGRDSF
jgi:hypothetical protein